MRGHWVILSSALTSALIATSAWADGSIPNPRTIDTSKKSDRELAGVRPEQLAKGAKIPLNTEVFVREDGSTSIFPQDSKNPSAPRKLILSNVYSVEPSLETFCGKITAPVTKTVLGSSDTNEDPTPLKSRSFVKSSPLLSTKVSTFEFYSHVTRRLNQQITHYKSCRDAIKKKYSAEVKVAGEKKVILVDDWAKRAVESLTAAIAANAKATYCGITSAHKFATSKPALFDKSETVTVKSPPKVVKNSVIIPIETSDHYKISEVRCYNAKSLEDVQYLFRMKDDTAKTHLTYVQGDPVKLVEEIVEYESFTSVKREPAEAPSVSDNTEKEVKEQPRVSSETTAGTATRPKKPEKKTSSPDDELWGAGAY